MQIVKKEARKEEKELRCIEGMVLVSIERHPKQIFAPLKFET